MRTQCEVCGRQFSRPESIRVHMETMHSQVSSENGELKRWGGLPDVFPNMIGTGKKLSVR